MVVYNLPHRRGACRSTDDSAIAPVAGRDPVLPGHTGRGCTSREPVRRDLVASPTCWQAGRGRRRGAPDWFHRGPLPPRRRPTTRLGSFPRAVPTGPCRRERQAVIPPPPAAPSGRVVGQAPQPARRVRLLVVLAAPVFVAAARDVDVVAAGFLAAGFRPVLPAGRSTSCRTSLRNTPVWLAGTAATCSGVPSATIMPPPEPPSGPMSPPQSSVL